MFERPKLAADVEEAGQAQTSNPTPRPVATPSRSEW
jgi:hypothetical protein